MIIVAVLVLAVLGVSFVRFAMDDFGEYNCLKSYWLYLWDTLAFPCEVLMDKLKMAGIQTSKGILYCPIDRPEDFFKEGDEVIFFNIRKRTPHYGEDMGVVTKVLQEGPVMGIIKSSHENDEGSTVRVVFAGKKELDIYYDSPLLMHRWELALIRKNPILRQFYCAGVCETKKGLNSAIKAS